MSQSSSNASTTEAWLGKNDEQEVDGSPLESAASRGAVRRLLVSLTKPYRKSVVVVVLLSILQNVATAAAPYLVMVGMDKGIPPLVQDHNANPVIAVASVLLVCGILQALTGYAIVLMIGKVGQTVVFDLRCRLFEHIQRLGIAFGERYTSGRIIARLTSDIDAVQSILHGGLASLVWANLTIVTVSVMLFVINWKLALAVAVIGIAVTLLSLWFRRNATIAFRQSRDAAALVIIHFVESLRGVAAVQAFRRELKNEVIFEELNETYREAKQTGTRLSAVYAPGVRAMGNTAVAIVLLLGGMQVLDGNITVGVLTAFLLYLRRLTDPLIDMSQFYTQFVGAAASLEKIASVLEQQPTVEDSPTPVVLVECRGEIDFSSVRFGYGSTVVLDELNLHIPEGQTVAFVGTTGAGKSTIARLLARFYDPNDGVITLDGVDLRDISQQNLRSHLVMVTQESFLFSGMIAENIAFGKLNATRSEIEQVACDIGADDFIRSLSDGYDTHVGKRGAQLSAGERQLISFARAMIANPRVLILDEATSSLDLPSERRIQQALEVLLAGRTAVIIAHRISTVQIADRVVVIEHGKIVEDTPPSASTTLERFAKLMDR